MDAPDSITLRRPDDWHLHLRDGAMLRAVLPHTARVFGRALVMPNLVPPVRTVEGARAYRERILAALPDGVDFEPLLTCYLTDDADPDEVVRGHREGAWLAVKLYPAHATTHSAHGVTDLDRVMPVLQAMAEAGVPLCIHGEVVDREVDIFDREAVFCERVLKPLLQRLPELRVVLEHVTSAAAVELVRSTPRNLAATVTLHHLVINRNALFDGGLRPHAYCLPVAKRERDRQALRRAVTSGDPRFFLGTDSAPHTVDRKEADCGCAGIFSAPVALQGYAQVFEEEGALDRLEGFASLHGPAFYGLPPNEQRVRLVRPGGQPPDLVATEDGPVRVFGDGAPLRWRFQR